MDAPDFDGLRRRGIEHAQAASGHLWTDFNVHDPGVTLLEQAVYALTEVVYRAGLPIADLLTGPDGRIDFDRLRLAPPRAVLGTRPVTARDLALALAEDAAVERVIVCPRTGEEAGRYDLFVVPAQGADAAAALAAVARAFGAQRGLCEEIGTLEVARPVPCRLEARVEVRRHEPPERAAALVYDCCAGLMRDRGAAELRAPATREDAFAEPARLFASRADPEGGAGFLDAFFAALTRLDEVADVEALVFRRLDGAPDAFAPLERGAYRTLVLPASEAEVGLVLLSRGIRVPFDLHGMQAELARLAAGRAAAVGAALEAEDWAPPPSGRRRDFGHLSLADGMPPAYRIGREGLPRSADPAARAHAGQLRGYVALLDAPLAHLNAGLESLPDLFAGDDPCAGSYRARPLAFGTMPELARAGPDAAAEAVADADPADERRARMLDYLLALYGEGLAQHTLRLFDQYRGPAARRRALVTNRARLLAEVATLDRDRSAAPDYAASQRCQEVGMGRKLAILLDYPDRGTAPLTAALVRSGLRLVEGAGPDGPWALPPDRLAPAEDPFAMLVPRRDPPDPVVAAEIVARTDFLRGGQIGAAALRRGVQSGAYLVAPEGELWRPWLDPGEGGRLLACGPAQARGEAGAQANAVRAFLTELNRRSEGAYLVEERLLGGPLRLAVVQPDWTARTADPDFRRLAEDTVAALCPAHLEHRVLWLDFPAMAEFEARHLAWRVAYRDAARGSGGGAEAAASALLDVLGRDP